VTAGNSLIALPGTAESIELLCSKIKNSIKRIKVK
jgi:hypothetical protein